MIRGLSLLVLCALATAATARHHGHRNKPPAEAGQFDYYLLSLSWSPSYCLAHSEDRAQCTRGFGFVLHGLWPQDQSGGYPENCTPGAQLSSDAAALGQSLFPSPKLMQHEWERHGTCSGMDAVAYFKTADRALAAVKVPAVMETPRAALSMTAADILAAFHGANPRLPENGMTVACSRAELSEVRVCLTKDLVLTACGRGVRNSCPDVALSIPAAR